MTIDFEIPIRVVSEANQGGKLRTKIRRKKLQKQYTAMFAPNRMGKMIRLPITVLFMRVYPSQGKPMDDDNLVGSFKYIRDAIAELFGVDDKDKRIKWECGQKKVKGADYGVHVKITERANLTEAG